MRIIGGASGGRRLRGPKGKATRPTGDRVKQTLFDILAPRIVDARFLDAFAGAGGIGLEALSRGAARVVFVDTDREAVAAVHDNLKTLGALASRAEVFRQDARAALAALAEAGRTFDIVYLDPPYASPLYEEVMATIAKRRLLAPGGLTIAEHFHKRPLPETIESLVRGRVVRVGDHQLSFYGWAE